MPPEEHEGQKVREAAALAYGAVEVPASDLKNNWHHWLDRVARGRDTVVVTRYGKAVATLAPVDPSDLQPVIFGSMRGWVVGQEDLIGPIEEEWDADDRDENAQG